MMIIYDIHYIATFSSSLLDFCSMILSVKACINDRNKAVGFKYEPLNSVYIRG